MPAENFTKPATLCYAPWALVQHEGELHLAYLTSLYGGGPVFGPAMGGRGHLVTDAGEFSEPVISFHQAQLLKEWRQRPNAERVQKAKLALA